MRKTTTFPDENIFLIGKRPTETDRASLSRHVGSARNRSHVPVPNLGECVQLVFVFDERDVPGQYENWDQETGEKKT